MTLAGKRTVTIRWIPAHVRVLGYFSNIILISSFFGLGMGFNILGSVLGGFLEYLSMIAGFRFLLLVALAAYGLSYLMFRSGGKAVRCV